MLICISLRVKVITSMSLFGPHCLKRTQDLTASLLSMPRTYLSREVIGLGIMVDYLMPTTTFYVQTADRKD